MLAKSRIQKQAVTLAMMFFMLLSLLPMGTYAASVEGQEKTVVLTIGENGYLLGGNEVKTDVAPYIKNGRTMVPVAFVAAALGSEPAVWLPKDNAVLIQKGSSKILIKIDSNELVINNKTVVMDAAAEIKVLGNGGGRTMLPISYLAKALEVGYVWNDSARTVHFYGYNKICDKAGVFGPEQGTAIIEGNVTVKADGVTLRNLTVKGNLIIAEEVGQGTVNLENINVQGETFIRGGGKDSVHIIGGSYANITVENIDGQLRVTATGVDNLPVIIAEGAKGDEIILNGNFGTVTVQAPDAIISTQGQTVIDRIEVTGQATGAVISLNSATTVTKVILETKTEMKGTGTIKEAEIKADGVTFEKSPEKQTIAPNVATLPTTPPPAPTANNSSSGGNDGGPYAPEEVTATAITGADIGVTKGSIDFAYEFAAGSAPITFAQAKAAPYYLDLVASTVQLKTEGIGPSVVSAPIAIAELALNEDGEAVYSDFDSMSEDFGNFTNQPTHIKLSLVSKTTVNGVEVSNPWTYDTGWISFDSAELHVFNIYGDKESLFVKDGVGQPIMGAGLASITTNLTLDSAGPFGSSITWASSNTAAIANNGAVTRPAAGAGNAAVTLTATITKGVLTETKVFALTVLAQTAEPSLNATPVAYGATNPSTVISVTGDTFAAGATNAGNWAINPGATGLTNPVITLQGPPGVATGVTIDFSGTAAEGTLTLQAKAAALTGGAASDTVSVVITATPYDAPVPGTVTGDMMRWKIETSGLEAITDYDIQLADDSIIQVTTNADSDIIFSADQLQSMVDQGADTLQIRRAASSTNSASTWVDLLAVTSIGAAPSGIIRSSGADGLWNTGDEVLINTTANMYAHVEYKIDGGAWNGDISGTPVFLDGIGGLGNTEITGLLIPLDTTPVQIRRQGAFEMLPSPTFEVPTI